MRQHRAWGIDELAAALAATVLAVAGGCGGEEPPAAGPGGTGEETAQTYTVRGVVRQLPDPDDPSRQLLIHHEPIPDYVSSEGHETGMMPMTMPFPPAPGVDLSGISAGDWVEFTFEVDWESSPPMRLTAIRELQEPSGGT